MRFATVLWRKRHKEHPPREAIRRRGVEAAHTGRAAAGEGKLLTNVEMAPPMDYGEEAMPALIRRVRANLSFLKKHGQVTKTGDLTARWGLAPTETLRLTSP